MKRNIFTINSKMKSTAKKYGVNVVSFNLPKYKSDTGQITCPFARECVKDCYAGRNNFVRFAKTIAPKHEANLALTKSADFIEVMSTEILKQQNKRGNPDLYIRIHDVGDFYSPKYIQDWITIMNMHKSVRFYAYTHSYSLFVGLQLPDNFSLTNSGTSYNKGTSKIDIDTDTVRHAVVFKNTIDGKFNYELSMATMRNAGYTDASHDDLISTKWFNENNKIGLIYH